MTSFADLIMQRGISLLTNGDFAGAVADFTEAQRLNPLDPLVYANRGSAYFRLKDVEQALPDLDEAIRLGVRTSSIYFLRGRVYGALGKLAEAIADYDEAIQLDPNNHEALAHRGNLLNPAGRAQQGLPDLDKAIAMQPGNLDYHNMRGVVRGGAADFDGAIADLTLAIDGGRATADNYFYRGMAYIAKKDVMNGINNYRQALQIDPDHAKAPIMRQTIEQVEALLRNKTVERKPTDSNGQPGARPQFDDPHDALSKINEAIAQNPTDAIAYVQQSLVYKRLKQYEDAVTSAAKAISLDPILGDAYANRGVAYVLLGRNKEALPDLDKAISMGIKGLYGMRLSIITEDPPEVTELNQEATRLAQKNDLQAAREKFDEVIRRAPGYSGGYGNRANVLRLLKDFDGAVNDYTKAIQLEGRNAYALFRRAMAYCEQPEPDHDRAESDFTAAIAINPEMGMFYRHRALARLKAGRYPESIQDFEKYGELGGRRSEKLFIEQNIALAQKAMGQ